jgi:hypothetical protein
MRVAERAEETAILTGGPEFWPTPGARPWLQRSVASSRKFTPFATEIVPRPLGDSNPRRSLAPFHFALQ